MLWCGVPCKSFSWMSSSIHNRDEQCPFGSCEKEFVSEGNRLTCRSLILCAICLVRACFWFIEQPGGSTMVHFPYLLFMMELGSKLGVILDTTSVRWLLGPILKLYCMSYILHISISTCIYIYIYACIYV